MRYVIVYGGGLAVGIGICFLRAILRPALVRAFSDE